MIRLPGRVAPAGDERPQVALGQGGDQGDGEVFHELPHDAGPLEHGDEGHDGGGDRGCHRTDHLHRPIDGGTQGLYLLPFLEETDVLIVFDAVDYGLEPGTMKIVEDDEVPAFMGAKKMSLHQTGFQDVIATATLMGVCPEKLILIGCQPEELEDYGGGLRDIVAARIPEALQIACKWLASHGFVSAPGSTAPGSGWARSSTSWPRSPARGSPTS
mgnify:CR=1 FL=1